MNTRVRKVVGLLAFGLVACLASLGSNAVQSPPSSASTSSETMADGTYANPKQWGEQTFVGAVHIGDKGGYFIAQFTGSASDFNWYFPAPGQSDEHWTWAGTHRGTFQDPKDWREQSYVGAIHGRGSQGRFESKRDGIPGPTDYFPAYDDTGETETDWWKALAIDCPVLDNRAHPYSPPPASRAAMDASRRVFDVIRDRMKSSTRSSLKMSPAFVSDRFKDAVADTSHIFGQRGEKLGAIILTMASTGGNALAVSDVEGARGIFLIPAKGDIQFIEERPYDWSKPDTVALPKEGADPEKISGRSSFDCAGNRVIDVYSVMSTAAVDALGGDPEDILYPLVQMGMVNEALTNSLVDVRLQLAGEETSAKNFAITIGNLGQLSPLFGDHMKAVNADLLASFFAPEQGSAAAGMAQVNGRYEMGNVLYPTAYRHEVAHNAGGSHCNSGSASYAFGYKHAHGDGTLGTILCDNNIAYYSSPLIYDDSLHPLGNAATADMARVWREHGEKMSSYGQSKMPVRGVIH